MKKIEKILAPTDFSDTSLLGLNYALNLARGWGAAVTVYHVADAADLANYRAASLHDLIAKHEQALSRFMQEHYADLLPLVEVRFKVEIGSPAANIVSEADKEGSDLIVIATHGRTGLAHMLLGSVTEHVVRNANCPVFSVPTPRAR